MTSRQLDRLAPLSGVLFVIVAIVAIFSGSNTPDANASPAKVISYFAAHRSGAEFSSIAFVAAFLIFVVFIATLRGYLRRDDASETPATLMFGASLLMSVGATAASAIEYTLVHNLSSLTPSTAQALNALDNELGLITIVGGALVFGISAGVAILRAGSLPSWLGWSVIAIGVIAVIPPVAFFALALLVIWCLVTSILLYRRWDQSPGPVAEMPPVRASA